MSVVERSHIRSLHELRLKQVETDQDTMCVRVQRWQDADMIDLTESPICKVHWADPKLDKNGKHINPLDKESSRQRRRKTQGQRSLTAVLDAQQDMLLGRRSMRAESLKGFSTIKWDDLSASTRGM